jgi:AbrB family looped-hinge helix DNA binding protein
MKMVIDKFGRIVIPKKIRERLGLLPGSPIKMEERKNAVLIYPESSKPLFEYQDNVLVYMGQPTGDLLEAVKKSREERQAKFYF